MNAIRKILGVIWIAIGVLVAYFGVTVFGLPKVTSGKQEDLVFGIIILVILLPIVVYGLVKFGIYALQGEYEINE
jgi:membrane protease YdiL (CAAX protease family)